MPAAYIVEQSILLGLYGLCSGDKRSYEFVEAFQGDLTLVHSITTSSTSARLLTTSRQCKNTAARAQSSLQTAPPILTMLGE